MIRLLVCLVLSLAAPSSRALILSQLGKTYDHEHNKIPWKDAWNRGHMIGTMHGATGVAIAPYWFITAAHMRGNNPRVFDSEDGSFLIQEMIPLPYCDMMLCRVNRPFKRYSALHKSPVKVGQIIRLYGQSSSHWAKSPLVDSNGIVRGWELGEANPKSVHLRWGLGRVSYSLLNNFSWPFTSYDPEIGTNCAGVVFMDSGGGVFVGKELAGILARGTVPFTVRPTTAVPKTNCVTAFIHNITNVVQCGSDSPIYPINISTTPADAIHLRLGDIYKIIAPPIRLAVSEAETTNGWTHWTGGHRTLRWNDEKNATAPLYQSAILATGTTITYTATNLLNTEVYTVRLHFGSPPRLSPGDAPMTVLLNGRVVREKFDPVEVAGEGGKSVLELKDVVPTADSRASIALRPAGGRRGRVHLSALEVLLQR